MRSKILTLVLSFAVALGLWMYVVTNVSPEQEASYYGIPVVLENETALLDRDLMLLSGEDSTVSVRLHGNRADLNELNSRNITASVDLSDIYEPGVYDCDYRISYPSGVSSVTVAERLTGKVRVEVVRYATKQVPVRLVFSGELQSDLFVDQEGATLSAKTVTVEGPAEQVDQISLAGIEINRGELTETITQSFVHTLMNASYEPVDVPNVKVDVGEIQVTLPVEYMKEIKLTVDLVDGGGATKNENAILDMETESIMVSGSREALDKIEEWKIATVNLADVDVRDGYTEVVPINLPENLTNRSGLAEVEIQVRLKGMATKTLTLNRDQITILNQPEGMKAEIVTQKVEIAFRGPSTQVRYLQASQITATIDLADYPVGSYTVQLTISVKDADRVGTYGSYSVTVSLTVPEVDPDGTESIE